MTMGTHLLVGRTVRGTATVVAFVLIVVPILDRGRDGVLAAPTISQFPRDSLSLRWFVEFFRSRTCATRSR
jgi:hypothetical protein